MSANSPKWETVSHKKKATAADKKAAQKALASNAPIVDQMSPLRESSTIYSSAFSGSKTNGALKGSTKKGGTDAQSGKKQNQPKKKGVEKKKVERFNALDEALNALDAGEMKAQLEDVKTRCPDSRALWLGDLALFLNRKLLTKELDPVFPDKPSDYPLCKMSSSVKNVVMSLIKTYDEKMLNMFFQHCMRELENDLAKGHPVNGYRIFLQILAINNPHFVTSRVPDYLEIFKRRQSDRATSLTILWSCMQAGQNDAITGLQIWSKLMLPLLGQKMVSPYAIACLDRFLDQKLDKKRASEVLGPNEFFPIMDYVFTPNTSLPPNLQKQLMSHYPTLKSIAFQEQPESNLRKFFPSLLARTTDHCPDALKIELLECLVMCLCQDQQCFSKWRQMYDTHMGQSAVLMGHISSVWNKVQLPKKLLHETVRAFSVTNEELMETRKGRKDYEDCRVVCKELLEKMTSFSFPWKNLISVVFLAIATFLVLDFSTSGGFQGSRTETFLKKSGLLMICQHAWSKISVFTANAIAWLQVNVPIYYAKVGELCGPYLTLAVEKLADLWVWLVTVTTPARAWIAENAPIYLEWLLARIVVLLQHLQVWLTQAWHVISEYAIAGWTLVLPYLQQAWEFIAYYSVLLWNAVSPALEQAWVWLNDAFSKT